MYMRGSILSYYDKFKETYKSSILMCDDIEIIDIFKIFEEHFNTNHAIVNDLLEHRNMIRIRQWGEIEWDTDNVEKSLIFEDEYELEQYSFDNNIENIWIFEKNNWKCNGYSFKEYEEEFLTNTEEYDDESDETSDKEDINRYYNDDNDE